MCVFSVYSCSVGVCVFAKNQRGGGESITLRDCDLICILWSCVLVVTVDNWSMPLIPAPCLSTGETIISWDVCEIHELKGEDLLEALKLMPKWWLPSKEAFWDHELNLQHSESLASKMCVFVCSGVVHTHPKIHTMQCTYIYAGTDTWRGTLRDMGGKKVASRTAVACMVHGGLALSEDCTTLGSDHFLLHLHDYVKQYISKILQDIPDGIPLCAVGHIWAAVESRLLLRPLQWHPCYVNAAVSLKLINELLFLLHCHCKEHFTTK